MYWPTGPPRIYAAETQRSTSIVESEDGDDLDALLPSESTDAIGPGKEGPREEGARLTAPDSASEGDNDSSVQSSDGRHRDTLGPAGSGKAEDAQIICIRVSRGGHLFATITATSLTIWQTRPTVILAVVVRSQQSLKNYGANTSLLLRPDSAIYVVRTALGYLITYALSADSENRVYKTYFPDSGGGQSRRHSMTPSAGQHRGERVLWDTAEGGGFREVSMRFRMVIKIDAGISEANALDEELVVATKKPAAVQCIRWVPDVSGNQTRTELLSRMGWITKKTNLTAMVHNRAMNLSAWVTSDGRAYAVQRVISSQDPEAAEKLFRGYCFHAPDSRVEHAVKVAINARFSLIAVGCAGGDICVYTARDYVGNIPLSHRLHLPVSPSSSGQITYMSYSPDGYCLFVGFERGWQTWSVYGKSGGSSFNSDRDVSETNKEGWLLGVRDGSWLNGGSEILLVGSGDDRIWIVEMARSAVTGCLSSANVSRCLLQTSSGIMLYRGYDLPDLTTISAEASLWHHVQIPSSYLNSQWPIRSTVISPDGRYVAVAGRRGLAHYSVNSGRWKTFDSELMEDEFGVRGGMIWHQHILIAAVESGDSFELRLYSRELALDNGLILHTETLSAPVVLLSSSGEDSLLVYTYENVLYHYIITAMQDTVRLVQVGQIAFHGIVRAPARVRGLSWVLPDEQLHDGDPSQDVAVASVIFLVDGKLVVLQPSTTEAGELRYDMRVVAHSVEYYALMRDQSPSHIKVGDDLAGSLTGDTRSEHHGLHDSLWTFDGNDIRVWTDVQDITRTASADPSRELPLSVRIPVDFYPVSVILHKGVILGIEPSLIQRRDVNFALFRFSIRTHLFLPHILRHYLAQYDSPAALHLSHHYQSLLYFPHALEILLHDVLDEEADQAPAPDNALLPSVLSFLSSFPEYLDILVQCTRKTEVRSWRTLFAHLPPPQELFEKSLQKGLLKTAGGYLLVLHTFEELGPNSEQLLRLLSMAKEKEDWELCKELARFLVALDPSGKTLREALENVDLRNSKEDLGQSAPYSTSVRDREMVSSEPGSLAAGVQSSGLQCGDVSPRTLPQALTEHETGADYFSPATGR